MIRGWLEVGPSDGQRALIYFREEVRELTTLPENCRIVRSMKSTFGSWLWFCSPESRQKKNHLRLGICITRHFSMMQPARNTCFKLGFFLLVMRFALALDPGIEVLPDRGPYLYEDVRHSIFAQFTVEHFFSLWKGTRGGASGSWGGPMPPPEF
jgi:hypothetical protein